MEVSERFTPRPSDLGGVNPTRAGAPQTTHSVTDAAGPAVDRMASGAHEAVDKMADAVVQAAETLDVKSEQLKNLQVRWLEMGSAYIRDHPVKSLGIAMVGGFLLSRLFSSR